MFFKKILDKLKKEKQEKPVYKSFKERRKEIELYIASCDEFEELSYKYSVRSNRCLEAQSLKISDLYAWNIGAKRKGFIYTLKNGRTINFSTFLDLIPLEFFTRLHCEKTNVPHNSKLFDGVSSRFNKKMRFNYSFC